jgi:aminocarboxymuconate-semialdehyde decarboxylase
VARVHLSGGKPPRIDFHAHVLDPYVVRLAGNRNVASGFGARAGGARRTNVEAMTQPQIQIDTMDQRGIDMHMISSPTIIQGTAWASPQTDLELCRRVNDTIACWVACHPTRFIGSFVLPLQDLHLAIPEMERAVRDLGLKVANLPANVQGIYLGDVRMLPLWEALDALGAVAFIHPDGIKDPWFQNYALWNSLGQSIEETKVMASLIYEGTLDRFPNVPIVMAHGGGYFPHYTGRLDRNATNQPDSMKNIKAKPSEYLGRFHYDTCVYDPQIVRALVARVGADHLVMGSDFPVNMSDPLAFLKDETRLAPADVDLAGGAVAARLLGL